MSTRATVDSFIAALRRLEDGGDVEPVVAMFAEDARIETATSTGDLRGRDGARRLWTEDRGRYATVHSDFYAVVVDGDRAALEWRREAEGTDGADRSHAGVSMLEVRDGLVERFGAYFDAARLAPPAGQAGAAAGSPRTKISAA